MVCWRHFGCLPVCLLLSLSLEVIWQCCERCFCQLRSGRSSGLVRSGQGLRILFDARYVYYTCRRIFGHQIYQIWISCRLARSPYCGWPSNSISHSMFTMHLHWFRSFWSVLVGKYFTAGVRKFCDGKITAFVAIAFSFQLAFMELTSGVEERFHDVVCWRVHFQFVFKYTFATWYMKYESAYCLPFRNCWIL